MLKHPVLDELRLYSGNELAGVARRQLGEHVLACAECRAVLQWLDAVRAAARSSVPAPPAEAWSRIATRVAAGEIVILPHRDLADGDPEPEPGLSSEHAGSPGRLPWRARWGWRVAVLALVVAGGAAAAVSDGWLQEVVRSLLTSDHEDVRANPVTTPTIDLSAEDGVSAFALVIEPALGAVRVTLQQPHPGVLLHVRLTDGDDFLVEALGGATTAAFRTSPGRLEVVGGDSGPVVLWLPRRLRRAQVDVNGRTLLLKEGDGIRIFAPSADTIGSEFILPVRAGTH